MAEDPAPSEIALYLAQSSPYERSKLPDLANLKKMGLFPANSIPNIKQCKPDSVWAVIKGLLAFDPNKRLSVEEAIQKPWFVYKMMEARQHEESTLMRLKELIQQQTLETNLPPNKLAYAKGGGFTQTKTIVQTKVWGILSPQDLPLPHFANYVPRLELQSILQKRLLTDTRFTACQGSPGIGKTQLVTYLTHDQKIKDHYGMRLWFRSADQPTQIEIQYLTLAQELNLAGDKTTFKEAFPRILHYIKTYLEKHKKPLLIVFDNADDPKVLRPYLPEGANILVTTRSKEWEETIAVERLSPNEGQILVQKLLSREELAGNKPIFFALARRGNLNPVFKTRRYLCQYAHQKRPGKSGKTALKSNVKANYQSKNGV